MQKDTESFFNGNLTAVVELLPKEHRHALTLPIAMLDWKV